MSVAASVGLGGNAERSGYRLARIADGRPELPSLHRDDRGTIEFGIEASQNSRGADVAVRIDLDYDVDTLKSINGRVRTLNSPKSTAAGLALP
jgi:hypothetical protein